MAIFWTFFFPTETAITEFYTLSLHDALPISGGGRRREPPRHARPSRAVPGAGPAGAPDRAARRRRVGRSEEHTSELQSRVELVCRLLLEKKKVMTCPDYQHGLRSNRYTRVES